jgi:hypothetical protein
MLQSFLLSILLAAEGGPDFSTEIAPLLERRCAGCHGGDEPEGGFRAGSLKEMIDGGVHGIAMTPGHPESSRLWLMVAGRMEPRMPPLEEEPLGDEEIALLGKWIEKGAMGPAGETRILPKVPKIDPQPDVSAPVTAIVVSEKGNWQAEGRYGSVILRSANPTRETRLSVSGKVTSLEFSPDEIQVVVSMGVPGSFGRATIYNVATGQLVAEFSEHRDLIYDATFSPDGKQLATAGYDRQVLIWDVASGKVIHRCNGHNGAVYDLAFSKDGKVLASASADNTVKLWSVATGERLDTLGQPQGNVLSVAFSPDDRWIVAGSADNRFRVWEFVSRVRPKINPLRETRYADETPIVKLRFTSDGQALVLASQSGTIKLFNTKFWDQEGVVGRLADVVSSLSFVDQKIVRVGLMSGQICDLALPEKYAQVEGRSAVKKQPSVALRAGTESPSLALRADTEMEPNNQFTEAQSVVTPAEIAGVIDFVENVGEEDWFRFSAKGDEEWMIEVKAARDKSRLDSVVEVRTVKGEPIERTRLQAVRDTYFTFRGKDSDTSDDFRVFAWEEMELDEYFYSSGEVVKLWRYPRGPDSGFKVYPGEGKRWTYFGSSPIAHALGEPAYIVRPLAVDQPPLANGLPTFSLKYINDDDSQREWGADSRLLFKVPQTGEYLVRIRDTRGEGGSEYKYRLTIRPAQPDFSVTLTSVEKPIPRGAGREFALKVSRTDGFDGPVEVHIEDLPYGVHATTPIVIESGQATAEGILYADANATIPEKPFTPTAYASAIVHDRKIKKPLTGWKPLEVSERPKVQVLIEPTEENEELTSVDAKMLEVADSKPISLPEEGPVKTSPWTLRIKPGSTVAARLAVLRDKFQPRVEFGKEEAGRNTPFGTFVDNVGLNGLMIPEGASRRTFFITAAPVTQPQRRLFYLKANVDGGITSWPIVLAVE